MEAVPLHLREANSFVARHHQHNKPTVGAKFALGAAQDGKLVGVAIVGRPYGAEGVLYFTYWTPFGPEPKQQGFHNAIIDEKGERTPKYDQVKRLNGRIKALAPTLLKLRTVAVYHTDPVPQGAQKLDPKGPVAKATGGELLIGSLKDDTNNYLFLVNRSLKKKSLAQVALTEPAREVEEISQDKAGEVKKASFDSTKGLLETSLEPGEGKLFVVRR